MPIRRFICAAIVALALAPATAHGASIQFVVPFAASPIDLMNMAPFDTSLGTLNSVDITINGVLVVDGQTLANGFVDPFAGFLPVAYQYLLEVEQDYDGLGAKFFEFSSPAKYMFFQVATGQPSPFTVVTPFSYGLHFDALTDLIGFDFPTVSADIIPPLNGVIGPLSAFLDTTAGINQVLLSHTAIISASSGPLPIVSSVGASGSMLVEYSYTPLAVPEPGVVLLMTCGLVGTLAARNRRSRPRV